MKSSLIDLLSSLPPVSQSVAILAGTAFFFFGVLLGRTLFSRARRLATMISDQTRETQSQFDLVSRDVIKVRQDLASRLAKHNQFISRWTRS